MKEGDSLASADNRASLLRAFRHFFKGGVRVRVVRWLAFKDLPLHNRPLHSRNRQRPVVLSPYEGKRLTERVAVYSQSILRLTSLCPGFYAGYWRQDESIRNILLNTCMVEITKAQGPFQRQEPAYLQSKTIATCAFEKLCHISIATSSNDIRLVPTILAH